MVLLYSEACYRLSEGFRLFDFFSNKSGYGFRLFVCPLNIVPLEARAEPLVTLYNDVQQYSKDENIHIIMLRWSEKRTSYYIK